MPSAFAGGNPRLPTNRTSTIHVLVLQIAPTSKFGLVVVPSPTPDLDFFVPRTLNGGNVLFCVHPSSISKLGYGKTPPTWDEI